MDARKQFEAANNIQTVQSVDALYRYNKAEQQQILSQRPWTHDVHYFKRVKISSAALLKMITHARSGGHLEVMGMLQGKLDGDTMIVMEAFSLPVEGTETRVSAQTQAYEYMVQYTQLIAEAKREENVIGWYHSHPGYGAWLSGIDVGTQKVNQQFSEPYVALVIDPVKTISSGKVELGAFRTYPENYKAPDDAPSEYQTIPADKIEDFGVHCRQYYPLEVSYFKSSTDAKMLELLWNKYWVTTLSTSPLLTSNAYVTGRVVDLAHKLEQAEKEAGESSRRSSSFTTSVNKKEQPTQLSKATKDCTSTTITALQGLMSQIVKDMVFNNLGAQ